MNRWFSRLFDLDHPDPEHSHRTRSQLITEVLHLLSLVLVPISLRLKLCWLDWKLRRRYQDLELIQSDIRNGYAAQKFRHSEICELESERRKLQK